ncbi:MAG: regulatory protein RecX [Propionibacteriales bacterium]|nr:regulatory protein RecX [Propionibacteriales bacterium]
MAARSRSPKPHAAGRPQNDLPPEDDAGKGPEADPESVARAILLDRLSARPRTRAELAETLASKRVPDEIATRLLDRFEEVGLIDDAAFARAWVESRQAGRGLARKALARELRRKGVADEIVREAVDSVDSEAEADAARAVVRRKLRGMTGLEPHVARRRLVGMLARRGYPAGVAFRVVSDELEMALDDHEAET